MEPYKRKILFYCQHLRGVGHLTRSLALCRALVDAFDVTFVQGGPDIGRSIPCEEFRHVLLPPLLMSPESQGLFDPVWQRPVQSVFEERRAQLAFLVEKERFDVVITELFPFGRKRFREEIFELIRRAKEKNSRCRIVSSVRDILVEKEAGRSLDRKIAECVNESFDAVLVHADPTIVRFEETFSEAHAIMHQLSYTGFVTEERRPGFCERAREGTVLVSMGGGGMGAEMIMGVLGIVDRFPELCFRFALGPYCPSELRTAMAAAARKLSTGRIQVEEFLPDFECQLSRASLSISLAGYNTVMNILQTKTPALVFPHRVDREQVMRAERLEAKGLLRMLRPEELSGDRLPDIIVKALTFKPSNHVVDLSGGMTSRAILLRLVQGG